jgi:outer membrane translocation and assembly module TamA
LKLFLFIFFSCILFDGIAQFKIDTTKKVNFLAVPILFRTPETGWAYGLSSSASFKTSFKSDTLTRTSVIQLMGIFSQRQQNIQAIDATIYFPKESYILYFQSSHSYFPDNLWGIGQHTNNDALERFASQQFFLTPHFKKRIWKRLFAGAIADYQNLININYQQNGVFDKEVVFGRSPYQILGLGLSLSYDTRNVAFWPTKGVFFQTQGVTYNSALVSDYDFTKWMMEFRFFKSIAKNHILAGQIHHVYNEGNVPFRSLSSFGGANQMRGFYQGRFKDKSMYSVIVEYRPYLFWKLSACVFAGTGNVYSQFNQINLNQLKYSFGGGLRMAILEKEKLHLRVDYGYSDAYNQGFYFTIGECF